MNSLSFSSSFLCLDDKSDAINKTSVDQLVYFVRTNYFLNDPHPQALNCVNFFLPGSIRSFNDAQITLKDRKNRGFSTSIVDLCNCVICLRFVSFFFFFEILITTMNCSSLRGRINIKRLSINFQTQFCGTK